MGIRLVGWNRNQARKFRWERNYNPAIFHDETDEWCVGLSLCAVPTYSPVSLQAQDTRQGEQYILVVTWNPPPLEQLDGRLVSQFEVKIFRVEMGQSRLVISSTMTPNITR